MRVAIATLGCKVNQLESDAIAEEFMANGHEVVPFPRPFDICVVNTCAVTAKASAESRRLLRRARRLNPEARIVATGCLVQVAPQDLMDALGWQVCLVGNDQKDRLAGRILAHGDCIGLYMGDVARLTRCQDFPVRSPLSRTRAYLKVQDGCNAFCSYCIVPYARGRSRSLFAARVLEQVETYAEQGIREVVVTGIHVGMYGTDLAESPDLAGLLSRLCETFPRMRFRLSSIEPLELTHGIIEIAQTRPNFARHFHIPLQSGSDRILRAMNRKYTGAFYRDLVTSIHERLPDAAIGADVLVGFPGEDDEAFGETLSLIGSLPLSYVHAFPFSRRPFTLASALPETVGPQEKARRVDAVRRLGARKREAFYRSRIEAVEEFLVERIDGEGGFITGTTSNYLPARIRIGDAMPPPPANSLIPVRITDVIDGRPIGVPAI